jgi:ribokinase
MVDASGENSIVVAPGANQRLEPEATARAVRRLLGSSGVLVTQAEIPEPAFEAAVRTATEVGARAVVNLAPYRAIPAEVLALCDPLVVNESEVSGLLGRRVRGPGEAREAVSELRGRVRSAVVTVGAAGAVVGWDEGVDHLPADATDTVDTTGAGDAFTGALAAALSAGLELVEAVRIGVRAGTYAVGRPGAQSSFPIASALGLDLPHKRR